MQLLYCDETNLVARPGDFFVYAGLCIDSSDCRKLSHKIDRIRTRAGIPRTFPLKFKPKPNQISHETFNAVKQRCIEAAAEYEAKLLVSAILHDIATSPTDARRNEINRICYHFDCLLNRWDEPGLVLIDRFSDTQIDGHLANKFAVGIVGLPYTPRHRLKNVVGFHYSAIGQSNFASLIDIIIGSLRFSINALTRREKQSAKTANFLLNLLEPLFFRSRARSPVSELSFFFSPKTIRVDRYRASYTELKAFLAEAGIATEQPITAERRY